MVRGLAGEWKEAISSALLTVSKYVKGVKKFIRKKVGPVLAACLDATANKQNGK